MDTTSRLPAHLEFVHQHSPYYRELWSGLWSAAGTAPPLEHLPRTDHAGFWEANRPEDNRLLTGPHQDGVVFKSGGTTGNPKFSYFSNKDWNGFCHTFGQGMRRGGLAQGHRVANIFYGGQLYASLLFIGRCIEEAGVGINYPIAGFASPEEIIADIKQFSIDTLAGVPTSMMNLLPFFAAENEPLPLTRLLYGGEAMYPDQLAALRRVLPGCQVQSIGVAGVDYGEMGWVDADCSPGIHRSFDDSTVLELLDEDGQSLQDIGAEGDLYITNFQRQLMPVIRYPVGDRGCWLDPPGVTGRRFKLLGRTEKGIRLGPVTVYAEDFQRVLEAVAGPAGLITFQLVLEHEDCKDRCRLRVALSDAHAANDQLAAAVVGALYQERPLFLEALEKGLIHPLVLEWVKAGELRNNPRTGKLIRILDQRLS